MGLGFGQAPFGFVPAFEQGDHGRRRAVVESGVGEFAIDPGLFRRSLPTQGFGIAAGTAPLGLAGSRLAGGAAVLIVTHDRDQAERLAARRLTMAGGRLQEAGQ